MVAVATCVEPVALAVANDEMLRRMHDQQYEIGGVACSIEWVALAHGWGTDELCEVLALPVGVRVDLGESVLVRVA